MPSTDTNTSRLIHYDLLRVIATFAVIFLHVAAMRWGSWASASVTSFDWGVTNFYYSLVRWSVPVFIMLSGCFFLNPDKKVPIDVLYKKYILRIIVAFAFWSSLYAIVMTLFYWYSDINLFEFFIRRVIFGHTHLWFLYAIVALYMIVPFLQQLTKNKQLMKYFMLLNFIFGIMIPTLITGCGFAELSKIVDKMSLYFVLGYSGYFVAGYYINTCNILLKKQTIIYILGIIGVLFTIVITAFMSLKSSAPNDEFHKYLTPSSAVVAVAIFVFFKEKISQVKFREKTISIINNLAECSFGIYLVHVLFIIFFKSILGISTNSFNPIFSIPCISILIFIGSFIVVRMMRNVPIFKKYII